MNKNTNSKKKVDREYDYPPYDSNKLITEVSKITGYRKRDVEIVIKTTIELIIDRISSGICKFNVFGMVIDNWLSAPSAMKNTRIINDDGVFSTEKKAIYTKGRLKPKIRFENRIAKAMIENGEKLYYEMYPRDDKEGNIN